MLICDFCGAQAVVVFWQTVETLGGQSLTGEGRSLGVLSVRGGVSFPGILSLPSPIRFLSMMR